MIFILDDDASVRTSLTRLMRSAGYPARAYADAQAYLNDVEHAQDGDAAGCLVVDLHVPGMSGLDLQEVINRRESPLPVIVLTASDDAELCTRALAAGAARVLRKPCDTMVLLRAVAEATRQSPPPPPPADDPDHFAVEEGRGVYRPVGCISFDTAVALVRSAIAAARTKEVRDLLVDTTALTGFASPDMFERFLAAVEWAEEGRRGVRLAMVARPEMIHPQKFGVIVAANRGMVSNIFPTEAEARAWLAACNF